MRSLRWASAVGATLIVLASATYSVPAAQAATGSQSGPVTKTETVTRNHLIDGTNHVVDTRKVTLKVDQTRNVRGRQEIDVSWSGAHPTGGIIADQNSIDAQEEEYPFVLLECRGVASTTAPAAQQVRPQTCWTQDWSERYQETYQTRFPSYRLDRYATAGDRAQVADAPSHVSTNCFPAPTQHWVPFIAADGHVYQDGPAGCAGQPPESQSVGGSAVPSNETFGVTGLDGRGSAKFDVWTDAENASLGCNQNVPCSLVAIPIMGISCDPAAAALPRADRPGKDEASAAALCEKSGNFAPGQLVTPQNNEDLAVSGSLWWSASNWRNRMVVPLNFAVPADACEVVHSSNVVQVFGSELIVQATGQWAPHFCLNSKLFNFTHVQTGEPQARNLLATGSAEAAFVSDPPPDGYGRAVVNAPVAVTGFAITYVIDAANGQPYTRLRLTPRLLAKLLTESYPAELAVKHEFAALANNPLNITDDPEFIKLNPGITHGVDATDSASTLLALASDSDVIRALTTYINDDPAARAWLNGAPDQWGMVVNPAYKGMKLPVDKWPLLSNFEPKKYYAQDLNDCLYHSPVPFLPLVAAPLPALSQISEAMQFAIAQSTTACSQIDGTSLGEKLVALGRQTVGYRFMIGVTSLADSYRFKLNTAALEAAGTDFVTPSPASLRAAVPFLKPNEKTGTWPVPYATFAGDSKAAAAYPGTMLVYAAIPTSGLPSIDAHDYAQLLRYLVGPGQQPGLEVGDLPPGYLPMTAANGLGKLAAYTLEAADAVEAQKGALPSLTGIPNGGRPTPTPTHTAEPGPTSGSVHSPTSTYSPPPAGAPDPGAPAPSPASPASSSSTPSPTQSTLPSESTSPASQQLPLARTPDLGGGGASLSIVLALGLALCGGIVVPLVFFTGRRWGRW